MIRGLKIIKTIYDLLKGIKRYLKTSMSAADIVIVTSHGLEDFTFNDVVYDNLDIVCSFPNAISILPGNIPAAKYLTVISGHIIILFHSVR